MNTMKQFSTRFLPYACTLALGLTALSDAGAVQLSSDGQGEVLIFPYYNTRGENDTLISVTNHRAETKALKIRVVEGELGRVIFTTNLYLPPFQRWNASFSEAETGPQLRSNSRNCTLPDTRSPVALNLAALGDEPDTGRASLDRAREGYIEVIEMGVVSEDFFFDLSNPAPITRPSDPAESCAIYQSAWFDADGVWNLDPQTMLLAPTGRLSGDAVIINVPEARASAYSATALKSFYRATADNDPLSLHSAPDNLTLPNLGSAAPAVSQVYLSHENPPRLVEDIWPDSISAVNASLMTRFIETPYIRDEVTNSISEHVFVLPTLYLSTHGGRSDTAPFAPSVFPDCEGADAAQFDQNGVPSPLILTTPPVPNFPLCHALTTLPVEIVQNPTDTPAALESSNRASPVLSSRLFQPIVDTDLVSNGWTTISFQGVFNEHQLENSLSGRRYFGLPVLGFTATSTQNLALNALFGTGFVLNRLVEIE